MTAASDNVFPKIKLAEGTAWATPASGYGVIYEKSSDGLLYFKNDAGTEYDLTGSAAGAVATDSIWDAKGDLVAGTAANAAATLTVGTNGKVLRAASDQTTGLEWAWTPQFVGCRLTHNTTQAMTTTITALNLNTESFDSDNFHDTVTNNTRATIPTGLGGKYLIIGLIEYVSGAATYRASYIRLDGTTYVGASTVVASNSINDLVCVTTLVALTAGQYVELCGRSGTNLNSNSTTSAPFLTLMRVGD